MTKVEISWQKIFDDFHVLDVIAERGVFEICADDIRKYREVRLMTKFDHHSDLPEIFKKNKLCILPLTRRAFAIGHFECYQKLKDDTSIKPKYMPIPATMESLSVDIIRSEQTAILAALLAGIFDDFVGDGSSYLVQTIIGRQGSGVFSYSINDVNGGDPYRITVQQSQMEIDTGLENASSIVIVEAKMFLDDDFLVRQLFYPYMCWRQLVSKPIKLVYMAYCDGLYKLFEFEPNGDDYNGLKLIKQMNYTIRENTISIDDIKALLHYPLIEEPAIPFPQADSVERILHMLSFLQENAGATNGQVALENEFVGRQTDYYMNAMAYLGLVEKKRRCFELSDEGVNLAVSDVRTRDLALAKKMLCHKVFRECLELTFSKGEIPDKETIVRLMKRANLYKVNSESTYRRRSSTISGWLYWILSLITPEE